MLVQRGLYLRLLSLPNCCLVLHSCSLPVLVSDVRSALQLPRKRMGWAHATNLSFEKVITWQDIGLENYVCIWSGRRRSTPKKCRGKSSEKTKPTAFDLLCELFQRLRADSRAKDCCRFYHQQDPPSRRDNQRLNGTAGSQQKST